MKKSLFAFFAAVTALAAVTSCDKEDIVQNVNEGVTFTATIPEAAGTRTILDSDGHSVTWDALHDIIKLCYYESGSWNVCNVQIASVSGNGKQGSFTLGNPYKSKTMTWAIYPYHWSSSPSYFSYLYNGCDNSKINISLKTEQPGKFADAQIMAAKVNGTDLPFQNVCGIFNIAFSDEELTVIKKLVIRAPGIVGDLTLSYNGSGFDVQSVGEGSSAIQSNVYSGNNNVYYAVRPGTYPAGSIVFEFYNSSNALLSKTTYNKALTVTPGMIVDWGDVYMSHPDNTAIIPSDFSSTIITLAGGINNITAVEFVSNAPGDKDPLETVINGSYPGPAIYAKFLYGKVTLRTPASNYYKTTWEEVFKNFVKLETVSGLENIDFKGVTSFSQTFQGTAIKTFDFTKLNSTSSLKNFEYMFWNSAIETVNMAGVDLGNLKYMNSMFSNCSNLTYVNMEGANLSNLNNLKGTFSRCSNLETINMKNVDLRKVTSMYQTFYMCSKLTDIKTDGVQTRDLSNLEESFLGCSSLTSLDLRWLNTENVTTMKKMFYNCNSLNSVDLSSFNTGKVTDFSEMFRKCEKLSSLDLGSFSGKSTTDLSYMFEKCQLLASINLSHFDTPAAKYFTNMFSNCSKLTSLDLSSFDGANVLSTSYMFSQCSSLASLNIGSLGTPNLLACDNMFWGCSGLTSLDLSSFNTSNATTMERMFDGLTKVSSLSLGNKFIMNSDDPFGSEKIGSANTSSEYYTSIRCSSYTWSQIEGKMGSNISHYQHLEIPLAEFPGPTVLRPLFKQLGDKVGGNENIKTITFFADCATVYSGEIVMNEGLGTYRIYGSVDSKGNAIIRTPGPGFKLNSDSRYFFSSNAPAVGGNAFSGLTQINGMELLNTETVTKMDYFFSGCSSLQTVDLSNFSTNLVASFKDMFSGCSSLVSLDFSSFSIVSTTPNCANMFKNCNSIVSLDLGTLNSNVSSIGSMFNGCTKLATLILGKNFTYTSPSADAFNDMGTANTTSAYYTTITCNSTIWSLLQNQQSDNISHYQWISAD